MKIPYFGNVRYRNLLLLPSLLSLVLAILLTLILSYMGLRQTLNQYIVSSQEILLQQVSTKIETLMSSARIVSNMYYYDDVIDTIINSNAKYFDEAALYDFYVDLKYIDERMESALINTHMPYQCIVMSDAGYTYSSSARVSDYNFSQYDTPAWDESLSGTNGKVVLRTPYRDDSKSWCWSFARLLKTTTNKPAGRLFINIDAQVIQDLYEDIAGDGQVFILKDSDTIVSSSDDSLIGHSYKGCFSGDPRQREGLREAEGGRYLSVFCPIPDSSLGIVKHMRLWDAFSPLLGTIGQILLYCLVIMGFFVVFLFFITSKAFLPFKGLCGVLSQVAGGNLDVSFRPSRILEFQRLNATCDVMITGIRHLIQNVQTTEERKRIAQIQALQAQIRPHFLHNTLFSIKCMVDMGKRETASDMLKHLCALLRSLQHNKDVLIPIGDEINELEQYIHLMGHRYPDSFAVHCDIERGVERYMILRHLLQPLVENAIFHGMRAEGVVNEIQVSLKRSDDFARLIIRVSDTGAGIEPEVMDRLFSPPDPAYDGHHLGLYNIYERLCLYFDAPNPITVTSIPYKETTFEITHPIMMSEDGGDDKDSARR